MNKIFILILAGALSAVIISGCGKTKKASNMAKLCQNCHAEEPGVIRGFLESIAFKSGTIQVNLQTRKEIIKFSKDVPFENINNLKEIKNYLGKGFKIDFKEEKGQKFASKITRFDILKTIDEQKLAKKVDKAAFKKLLKADNTVIFDARPPMKFKEAHIPGAKLLPAPAFDKFKTRLPADKSKTIVFYCVGGCLSPSAAIKTKSLGYKDVVIYTKGFPDWSKTEFGVTAPGWVKMAIEKNIPHVLIDLRSADQIKAKHIKGAVAMTAGQLSTAKLPKQKNAPIILYGPGNKAAAQKIISRGYRAVRILRQPIEKWNGPTATGAAKTEIVYVPKPKPGTITIADFKKSVAVKDKFLVDVRNPDEVARGTIAGSVNIPVDQLAHRLNELPTDKEVVVFCKTGIRAEMAFTTLKMMKIKGKYLNANIAYDAKGAYTIKEK